MLPPVLSEQTANSGLGATNTKRQHRLIFFILSLALAGAGLARAAPDSAPATPPPHGVIGVDEGMLSAQFWISRLANPDVLVLDKSAIALENARLVREDPTLYDLHSIPARPSHRQVHAWIEALSETPTAPMYDAHGKQVSVATLKALRANLDLGAIPQQPMTRYGTGCTPR